MLTSTTRAEALAVSGWSSRDLDNRAHAGHLGLCYGLRLPVESGRYIGEDCFVMRLSEMLAAFAGLSRALASEVVLSYDKWWPGLERIEWPELFPPPVPMLWAPTNRAMQEGATGLAIDSGIYLAIAKTQEGELRTACGTLPEIFAELLAPDPATALKQAPVITQVSLSQVYDATLEAAARAGVDLGAPFTRPERHPEHKDWYAAVEVHRALAFQRQKKRKPPGPARKRTMPAARSTGYAGRHT